MSHRGFRRVAGLALVFLLASVGVGGPALAQDEPMLTVATTATYRVAVDTSRVEVTFGYEFSNETEATAFPGFFESLPADAVDVVVRDSSGVLETGSADNDDDFDTWLVGFRRPLDPGGSVSVTLEWALESGPNGDPVLVVPGAASFDVYVPGPDGATRAPVEIVVPDGFSPVAPVVVTEPYEIVRAEYLAVDQLTPRILDLPPELQVYDWDPSGLWATEVVDRAAAVAGSLDSWFGPRSEPFSMWRTFSSAAHPAVGGDRFDLAGDDAESVDHQLAHAWLADVVVDEPWFIEGLAAAFAGDRPNPAGPAEIVPIVVNEIGAGGVRSLVDAVRAGTITYPGPVAEPQPLPPDWRTLLDHLEGVAGAYGVDELLRATSRLDDDDRAALDRRASARVDYSALDFRAGGWSLPPYLRHAMAAWEFDDFRAGQVAVSEVIVRRDALLVWTESLELEPRDDGKAIFEAAEANMDEVVDLLDEQEAALEAFDEAERLVNGDRGLLASVGLIGRDVDADLEVLRGAWAEGDYARVEHDGHELATLVESAVGGGTIRLVLPALAALAIWQLARLVRRRSGSGPAADGADPGEDNPGEDNPDDQGSENTSA